MTGFRDVRFAIGGTGLRGLDEALAQLDKLTQNVTRDVQAELEAIATRIVADMKARVAVEGGSLRESIRWFPAKKLPGVVIEAGGTSATIKPSKNGFQFDEALGIEYGTTKMAAQPFFFPTIEAHRGRAESDVKAAATRAAEGKI